jgi:hypothetical protein
MATEQSSPLAEETEIGRLRRQLDVLEAAVQLSQRPAATKQGKQPEKYNGSRKSRDVDVWLTQCENYFRLNPGILEDAKVPHAVSWLDSTPMRYYTSHTAANGEINGWSAFKTWVVTTFAPVDEVNTFRDAFFSCSQRNNESPDDYFLRYREASQQLDTPLPETYVVYLFVKNLQPYYREKIRGDKEFADYKVSLDEVVAKLKRVGRPGTGNPSNIYQNIRSEGQQYGRSLVERVQQDNPPNNLQETKDGWRFRRV